MILWWYILVINGLRVKWILKNIFENFVKIGWNLIKIENIKIYISIVLNE